MMNCLRHCKITELNKKCVNYIFYDNINVFTELLFKQNRLEFKIVMLLSVMTNWSLFLVALALNYDNRRPFSKKLKTICSVKQNSLFYKVIKVKDSNNFSPNYFKVIPACILFALSSIGSIILLIDAIGNGFLLKNLSDTFITVAELCIIGLSVVYFLVITIWWEIVDQKEFLIVKKEMQQISNIRKSSGSRKK